MVVEIVSAFNDVSCGHHVETSFVDGIDGVAVAGIAQELAGGEAEEVGPAVPLFAGREQTVAAAAAEDGLHGNTEAVQGDHQVGFFLCGHFLSVNGIVDGLEGRIHDDGLIGHAAVHIEHGEHHVEVDERLGCQR